MSVAAPSGAVRFFRGGAARVAALLRHVPEDPAGLRAETARVDDWPGLLGEARRHGVEGVLHHALGWAGVELPAAEAARSREQRVIERLHHRWMASSLDEVLAALDAAGVRAVPLKGPALAERIYPDPTLRPCLDLDVLVGAADLGRAIAALDAIGYRPEAEPIARAAQALANQLWLRRPGAPLVELHPEGEAEFGVVIPAGPLLARARPWRTASGRAALALAPEDEFLLLALHAAHHMFGRIMWLYDLKLLWLRLRPDGARVRALAREHGVTRALALACAVLARDLGGPAPGGDGDGAGVGIAGRLAGWHDARPFSSVGALLARAAFRTAVCDSPAALARFASVRLRGAALRGRRALTTATRKLRPGSAPMRPAGEAPPRARG